MLKPFSLAKCSKQMKQSKWRHRKELAELLTEELKLRETEALDSQQRADMALLEAKKLTSQYQKEADKCNSGMETCEEAREKAEAALVSQKQETAMWERGPAKKAGKMLLRLMFSLRERSLWWLKGKANK
nr:uncharacterized protein [Tanacetum cinerariifolium]